MSLNSTSPVFNKILGDKLSYNLNSVLDTKVTMPRKKQHKRKPTTRANAKNGKPNGAPEMKEKENVTKVKHHRGTPEELQNDGRVRFIHPNHLIEDIIHRKMYKLLRS